MSPVSSPDLPDASEYPLLHFLFSTQVRENLFDKLLNEVIRYHNSAALKFKQGNNTEGTLLYVPSFRTLSRYEKEFKKHSSILLEAVEGISRNAKCPPNDACESLIMGLCQYYDDALLSVAVKRDMADGALDRKMDEVSVEAMLSKAGKMLEFCLGISSRSLEEVYSFLRRSGGLTLEIMIFLQRLIVKCYQTRPSLDIGGRNLIFYYNIK